MNISKREKEIQDTINKYMVGAASIIIQQEQEIIKQKIYEFAKNFWKEEPEGNWMYITKKYTNDILKHYGIEEKI